VQSSREFLFHGTGIYSLANIVDVDRIDEGVYWGKPGEPRGPRFCRSAEVASSFVLNNIHWGEGGILVLDRKLLESDFQIVRYTDRTCEGHDWPVDELEEVPLAASIPRLHRYLVSIVCAPEIIEHAQCPMLMADARNECGWGFEHEDDQLAVDALKRLASSPWLNRWVPACGAPRMGNWTQPQASRVSPSLLATDR